MKREDINHLYYAVGHSHGVLTLLWEIEDWVRQVFDDTSFADRFVAVMKDVNEIVDDMYHEVKRLEKEVNNDR